MNLHIAHLYGDEVHHVYESVFKGFARALRQACAPDPRESGGDGTPFIGEQVAALVGLLAQDAVLTQKREMPGDACGELRLRSAGAQRRPAEHLLESAVGDPADGEARVGQREEQLAVLAGDAQRASFCHAGNRCARS